MRSSAGRFTEVMTMAFVVQARQPIGQPTRTANVSHPAPTSPAEVVDLIGQPLSPGTAERTYWDTIQGLGMHHVTTNSPGGVIPVE